MMTHANDRVGHGAGDAPLFSARLTPHRSLKPAGFAAVMGVIAALALLISAAFWAIGAWPIVGFLGIDVALVYVAFQANYRSARAYETVEVTGDRLTVTKVAANGRSRAFHFNPYWVRLEVDRAEEEGVTGLRIASHGQRLDVGRFLAPVERDSFAEAFADALSQVRTPAAS